METPGGFDSILTRQRVGNQKRLGGLGNVGNLGRLGHHLFVDRGAAGGIEDQDVIAADLGGLHSAARDIGGQLALDDRQRGNIAATLVGEDGELLHGSRTADVE